MDERLKIAKERLHAEQEKLRLALESRDLARERLREAETGIYYATVANLYFSWRGWPLANALRHSEQEQVLRSSLSLSKAGLFVKADFIDGLVAKWHLREVFKKALRQNGLENNLRSDPAIGLELLIALNKYQQSDPAKLEESLRNLRTRVGLIPS